ncbi:MAG: amidohydrolase family protein [Myxococcota bacterium]
MSRLAAVCLLLAACSLPAPPLGESRFPVPAAERNRFSGDWLLRRAQVLNVETGAYERRDLVIRDGVLAEPNPDIDLPTLDGEGLYVLPGLFDAHTHLASVPGALLRGDTEDEQRIQRRLQLRAFLASGVTSVLDCAITERVLAELRSVTSPSPTIFALSPFVTPSGGYFGRASNRHPPHDELDPPVETAADVEALIGDERDSVGVKVTFEEGMVFPIWPRFSSELRAAIRTSAQRHRRKLFVHSMDNESHRMALELEPYAFVHAGMEHEAFETDVLEAIKESGAWVITTAAVFELEDWMRNPNRLSEPWLRDRVPERQMATDPDLEERVTALPTPMVTPWWIPNAVGETFSSWFRNSDVAQGEVESTLRGIIALHRAGVPLVLGSDSGNWPVLATYFHGVGTIVEAELLERAGLPRIEVIRAATINAARMLEVDGSRGTVSVGKRADLVLYGQDPLVAGLKTFEDPVWVVYGGEARTPAGWLAD